MLENIILEAAMSAGQKTASKIGAKFVTGVATNLASSVAAEKIISKEIESSNEKSFSSKEEQDADMLASINKGKTKSMIVKTLFVAAGAGLFKLAETAINNSNQLGGKYMAKFDGSGFTKFIIKPEIRVF